MDVREISRKIHGIVKSIRFKIPGTEKSPGLGQVCLLCFDMSLGLESGCVNLGGTVPWRISHSHTHNLNPGEVYDSTYLSFLEDMGDDRWSHIQLIFWNTSNSISRRFRLWHDQNPSCSGQGLMCQPLTGRSSGRRRFLRLGPLGEGQWNLQEISFPIMDNLWRI